MKCPRCGEDKQTRIKLEKLINNNLQFDTIPLNPDTLNQLTTAIKNGWTPIDIKS